MKLGKRGILAIILLLSLIMPSNIGIVVRYTRELQ